MNSPTTINYGINRLVNEVKMRDVKARDLSPVDDQFDRHTRKNRRDFCANDIERKRENSNILSCDIMSLKHIYLICKRIIIHKL